VETLLFKVREERVSVGKHEFNILSVLDVGFTFGHVRMYASSCSPCPPSQKIELMFSSTFPRKTNDRAEKPLKIFEFVRLDGIGFIPVGDKKQFPSRS